VCLKGAWRTGYGQSTPDSGPCESVGATPHPRRRQSIESAKWYSGSREEGPAFGGPFLRDAELSTFLNLAPDIDVTALVKAVNRVGVDEGWIGEANYSALAGIHSVQIPELGMARDLLLEPVILESIYRLVVTLMRQGSAPLGAPHQHGTTRNPRPGQNLARGPAWPHLLVRPRLGRRRPSTIRTMPTTARISPM
jgi:hypothetical protein